MIKVKSRQDFFDENEKVDEGLLVAMNVKYEDETPDKVLRKIKNIKNLKIEEVMPFGVITIKAKEEDMNHIKNIEGVEDVTLSKAA